MMDFQSLKFPLLGGLPLLLALAVWQLEINPDGDTPSASDSNGLPQAIVEQPRILLFNANGRLQQSFTGSSLISSPDGDELRIDSPTFELADGRGDYWSLVSRQGLYQQTDDSLLLTGSVEMVRTTGDLPVQLTTEELRVGVSSQRVESGAPVLLQSVGHRLQGNGLRADLAEGTFELLNQVRAFHEIQ